MGKKKKKSKAGGNDLTKTSLNLFKRLPRAGGSTMEPKTDKIQIPEPCGGSASKKKGGIT